MKSIKGSRGPVSKTQAPPQVRSPSLLARVQVTAISGGVLLPVKVIPRARAAGVDGELGGALKLRLTSPPVDNKANAECQSVVAALFGMKRADVEIVRGATGRQKTLLLRGISLDHVVATLARVLGAAA